MKKNVKAAFWAAATLAVAALAYDTTRAAKPVEVPYSQFLTMVDEGSVEKVEISDNNILIYPYDTKTVYRTGTIDYDGLVDRLEEEEVIFIKVNKDEDNQILKLLLSSLPTLAIIGVSLVMMKAIISKGGEGGFFNAGKSNARKFVGSDAEITFENVAGQEEAKESLVEIIDYLKNPKKYRDIGAKLPKGALLVGPPGTGKTLLAKAVAGEAQVTYFNANGSEFVEMFVGVGASRIRDLFEQAKKSAPAIIFIDEIDAIGKKRTVGGNGADEREQTLNQLLSEMDGFDSNKTVVVLAATNRPEVLDAALLRPGRFDRRIVVDNPDLKGRNAILAVHSKDVKLAEDVNLDIIAKATSGASGADLENIINEGALTAARNNREQVSQNDLMDAMEVVFAGKEKKSRILSEKERKIVAYHEVGHAVVTALLKNTSPVQKITIIPRTMGSLGFTMQIPEEDKYLRTRDEILDEIKTLLGGRCAEEIFCNVVTTGASNDIERATEEARNYVCYYGMSDKFGMTSLAVKTDQYLSGETSRTCSETTAASVDEEIMKIIREAKETATEMLKNNKKLVEEITAYLLEKENITGDEFMSIFVKYHPECNYKPEEHPTPKNSSPAKENKPAKKAEKGEDVVEEGEGSLSAEEEAALEELAIKTMVSAKPSKDGSAKDKAPKKEKSEEKPPKKEPEKKPYSAPVVNGVSDDDIEPPEDDYFDVPLGASEDGVVILDRTDEEPAPPDDFFEETVEPAAPPASNGKKENAHSLGNDMRESQPSSKNNPVKVPGVSSLLSTVDKKKSSPKKEKDNKAEPPTPEKPARPAGRKDMSAKKKDGKPKTASYLNSEVSSLLGKPSDASTPTTSEESPSNGSPNNGSFNEELY